MTTQPHYEVRSIPLPQGETLTLPDADRIVRVEAEDADVLKQISEIAFVASLQKMIPDAARVANERGATNIDVEQYRGADGTLSLASAKAIFEQLPQDLQDKIAKQDGFLVSAFGPDTYKQWTQTVGGLYAYIRDGKVFGFLNTYAPQDPVLDYGSTILRTRSGVNVGSRDNSGLEILKQICVDPACGQKGVAFSLFADYEYRLAVQTAAQGKAEETIMLAIVGEPHNLRSVQYHEERGYSLKYPVFPPDGLRRDMYAKTISVADYGLTPTVVPSEIPRHLQTSGRRVDGRKEEGSVATARMFARADRARRESAGNSPVWKPVPPKRGNPIRAARHNAAA